MTEPEKKRSFGLLLRKRRDNGTVYVEASLASRETGREAPLGITDFRWEWPKSAEGLELDGLGLYGFVSDLRDDAGNCRLIGDSAEYRNVYAIDGRKAAGMAKTLKRVYARIERDKAHEPGDKLLALAKALKLEFVVEDRERFKHDPDRRWLWLSVAEGKNRYRQLIVEAEQEETTRLGGPKVAVAR